MTKRQRSSRSRGQALVEFALVAPAFFLLLFGIIEGGRFIFYYESLNNATREGARYAIVHGSHSSCPSGPMPPGQTAPLCYDSSGASVAQRVRSTALGVLGSSVTVTSVWDPHWAPGVDETCSLATTGGLGNARDSDVCVTARYTYQTLIPLVPLPPISITSESKLVINN
jgi:Flp pilus assembly protein TadG